MDESQRAGENGGVPGNQGNAAAAAPSGVEEKRKPGRSTGWRERKAARDAESATGGTKPPVAAPVPEAAKAGKQIDLERLRQLAPEEAALAEGALEKVDMDPKSVDAILSLAFYEVMKLIMTRLHRESVTMAEAEKWAEVSRIVWWEYLRKAEASQVVWVLFTAGLILSKKPLPEAAK